MNLWEKFEIKKSKYNNNGVLFHYEKSLDGEIKELFLSFSKWLRKNYVFPIHLNIYIVDKEKVKLKNNQLVYGRFRYYENRTPVIHIPAKIEEYVKDSYEINEIFDGVLSSLVHELTHYYQFVLDQELSERQANYYRFRIVDKFNFDRRC